MHFQGTTILLALIAVLAGCKGADQKSDVRTTSEEEEYSGSGTPEALTGVNLFSICEASKVGDYVMDCALTACRADKTNCKKVASLDEVSSEFKWSWSNGKEAQLLEEGITCQILASGLRYLCTSAAPFSVSLAKRDKSSLPVIEVTHSFAIRSIALQSVNEVTDPIEFDGTSSLNVVVVWQDLPEGVTPTAVTVTIGPTACQPVTIGSAGSSSATCVYPTVASSTVPQLLDLTLCIDSTCTKKVGAFKLTAGISPTPTPTSLPGGPSLRITVSGMPAGQSLVVRDGKGGVPKVLTFSSNTVQAFGTTYANGDSYAITLDKQPAGYQCSTSTPAGTINEATTVSLSCGTLPAGRTWQYGDKINNCLTNAYGPYMPSNVLTDFATFLFDYVPAIEGAFTYRGAGENWATTVKYSDVANNLLAIGTNEHGKGFLLTSPGSDSNYLAAIPISETGMSGSPVRSRVVAEVANTNAENDAVAVNLAGDGIISWGTGSDARVAHFAAATGTFGTASTLGTLGGGVSESKVKIGPNGNGVAIFKGSTPQQIDAYTYSVAGGWSTPATTLATTAGSSTLVMDKQGTATTFWFEVGGLKYRRFKNGLWGATGTVDASGTSSHPAAAAADPDGNILIFYSIGTDFYGMRIPFAGSETPVMPSASLAEDVAGAAAGAPVMTADAWGNAFVLTPFADLTVRISTYTSGSGWQSTTFSPSNASLPSLPSMTKNHSISFDATGNAVAAYVLDNSSFCEVHYSKYELP